MEVDIFSTSTPVDIQKLEQIPLVLAAQDNTLGRCILYTPLLIIYSFFPVKEHLIVQLLCLPECQTTIPNYLILVTDSGGWFILRLFCFGRYVKKQSDYNSASRQWSLADP